MAISSEKERFEKFVIPGPWSGCHEWMGCTQRYGKFTWDQVSYIRTCQKRSRELAQEFECHYTYIDQIRRGDVWKASK